MLTALDDTSDVVAGLEGGADDYMTKPFATDELVARLRSLIRRGPVLRRTVLEAAGLEVDPARRRVRQDGVVVPLTAKEFALLEFLAHRAGDVVERYDVLEHCWDHAYEPESNVVDVHVRALRRKLGDRVIETVRGAGYRMPEGAPAPAAAAARAPAGGAVMLADVEISTPRDESVGELRWSELVEVHDEIVRAQVAAHGGREARGASGGFAAAFDSAPAALRCAIAIQRALARRNAEQPDAAMGVRIGLDPGDAALAARIMAKAERAEILVSGALRELPGFT